MFTKEPTAALPPQRKRGRPPGSGRRVDLDATAAFVPPSVDVKAIRERLGLTQVEFALRFGFSAPAVRKWEQHDRQPEPAARTLLAMIGREVTTVERLLKEISR